ncbi:MAG: acyl-ACP--UDP-N-acetylglucosamine O-acyltransferase [Verrucomicrobiota bacterium]|nr:acyl-ACP--UDP-N-acetylglucosamine O-acyltransferase [Verrucomicrobiota bacterium]
MTVVHPTAVVAPGAEIGDDAQIGPYTVIGPHARIGAGARVMSHAVIEGHITIGRSCAIFPFASLGAQTQDLKYRGGATFVEIGDDTTIRECVTVNSGTEEGETTKVGSRCLIMAYAHIAHGCVVGDEVIMANNASLAGRVMIQDHAVLGGMCGIHQFVTIGRMTIIGGMSKVTRDCPPFMLIEGNPATARGLNHVALERRKVPAETRALLKKAYRILYRAGLNTTQAVQRIRAELPLGAEIAALVRFIESSERGIARSHTAGGHGDEATEHDHTAGAVTPRTVASASLKSP